MADSDRAILTKGQLKALGEMIRNSGGGIKTLTEDDRDYTYDGQSYINVAQLESGFYNFDNDAAAFVYIGYVPGTSGDYATQHIIFANSEFIPSLMYVSDRARADASGKPRKSVIVWAHGPRTASDALKRKGVTRLNLFNFQLHDDVYYSQAVTDEVMLPTIDSSDPATKWLVDNFSGALTPMGRRPYLLAWRVATNADNLLLKSFTGATSLEDGYRGMVPAPAIADREKYLKGNGQWAILEQSDWNTSDPNANSYIKNRPFYEYAVESRTTIMADPQPYFHKGWISGANYSSTGLPRDIIGEYVRTTYADLGNRMPYWGNSDKNYNTECLVFGQCDDYDEALPSSFTQYIENGSIIDLGEISLLDFMEEATLDLRFEPMTFTAETYTSSQTGDEITVYVAEGYSFEYSRDGGSTYQTQPGLLIYYNGLLTINYGYYPVYDYRQYEWVSGQFDLITTTQATQKLDSKFINVDNSTITVNEQGQLEAAGAGGITTLTTEDYNYPTDNPSVIAPWRLNPGIYYVDSGVTVRYAVPVGYSPRNVTVNAGEKATLIVGESQNYTKPIIFLHGRLTYFAPVSISGAPTGEGQAQQFDFSEPYTPLNRYSVVDNLTTTDIRPLSSRMGRELNIRIGDLTTLTTAAKTSTVAAINELDSELGNAKSLSGSTAPTTSTAGTLGQTYVDTSTGDIYYLSEIDETTSPATYTWEKLSTGTGVNVVQTTGTSTTDVMSQNAVTTVLGNVLVNGGTTVPTSSTAGQVGTQYNCVNNGEPEIYICTAVDTSITPNTYTWKKVGLALQLSTTDPGEGSPLADNTLLGIYE